MSAEKAGRPRLVTVTFCQIPSRQIVAGAKEAGLQVLDWGGGVHVPAGDTKRVREVAALIKQTGLETICYGSHYCVGHYGEGGKAPDGSLRPWLNELAFLPVNYRTVAKGAQVDERSGDAGTGARYHSQQGLGQLQQRPDIPGALPLPEKLVKLREAADRGEAWTRPVHESLGVYLGYALAHFNEQGA